MSKSISSGPNLSDSTGASNSVRGRSAGVPTVCWCGGQIIVKVSKSEANPYRRYFRCFHAYSNKLMDDNHLFKWVDEALVEEVEKLNSKFVRHEQMIRENELVFDGSEYEKLLFEKVELVLDDALGGMKKKMLLVVIGCVIIVGLGKLI